MFGVPGRDDDVAAYFHTGGTTGTPRLVAHTHRGQLVAALGGAVLGDMRPSDTLTATLPLFHVGGTIFCGLSAFMAGIGLLVMSPGGLRNPAMVQGFWRLVAQHRATLVGAVPTSVGAVLDVPLHGADIGAVRAGFCGAASLPSAVRERFRQSPAASLFEVYGMTEASGLIAIDPVARRRRRRLGRLGLALHASGRAPARSRRPPRAGCDTGEIGVITVSGPHVSPGYRNPRARRRRVPRRRLAQQRRPRLHRRQGRIHIAGRAKDLIIRSGHNIDPLMIENAMASHPAVALAAAVGMPDAYAGELPVCYVALRPGASVGRRRAAAARAAPIAERPAWPRQIHVVDAIPLTSVGKIYKPQLRCDAAARLVTRVVREPARAGRCAGAGERRRPPRHAGQRDAAGRRPRPPCRRSSRRWPATCSSPRSSCADDPRRQASRRRRSRRYLRSLATSSRRLFSSLWVQFFSSTNHLFIFAFSSWNHLRTSSTCF